MSPEDLTRWACEEARALGHTCVGTEHVLLAVLRDQEGPMAALLRTRGIPTGAIRERVATVPYDYRAGTKITTGAQRLIRDGGSMVGIARDGYSSAMKALLALGIDEEMLKRAARTGA